MKLRLVTKLRRFFIPALAALSLGIGISACSSDGESEQPEAGLTEEGNNAAAENANANANLENANLENANAEGDLSNVTTTEGNPAGNELQNLVNEGGAETAGNPAMTEDPAAAGADPFAANAAAANAAAAEVPVGGAPVDNAAMVPVDGAINNEAVPPANALAGTNANASAVNAENTGNENAENVEGEAVTTPETTDVAAVAGPLPENGTKMAYYIRPGDTLAIIAQKIYGDKGKWKELAAENNIVNSNKIYAGDVLYYSLDDKSKAFADSYESAPKKSVTVGGGDTLSQIAARVYGNESEWRTLWKENPQIHNPDVISAGMLITYRDFSGVKTAHKSRDDEDEEVAVTEEEASEEQLVVETNE